MKKVILLVLLYFSMQCTYAQFNQGIFATTASEYIITPSEGQTSLKAADGNILFVADYHKSGFSMLYAMKTDSNGNVLWKFDYDINAYFNPYSVTQLTGGNFVISGIVSGGGTGGSLPFGNYAFYVCINNSGTFQWAEYFTTTATPGTNPSVATTDGGFAATYRPLGTPNGSMLVKFTSSGTVSWNNSYNVGNSQDPSGIIQTSDGGYAVSGELQGPDGYFLMKFNSSGTLSWATKVAIPTTQSSRGLLQTSTGNYIITGRYMGTGTLPLNVCINSTGTSVLWALRGCTIASTTSNGFIAYTYQTDNSTYEESFLYKINSSGSPTPVWAKSYPQTQASNVLQYASSTFILSGSTDQYPYYSWSASYPLGLYFAKTYNGVNCGTGNHIQALSSVTGLTCSALSLSATAATLTPNTLSLTTYTPGTTVISKCACPADAGSNANDYEDNTGAFCTGVQIGTASSGYTYQWNPTSDLSCNTCAQPTCSYNNTVTPQNYTLTVTGASCLKALSSVKVTTLVASLTASVTATHAISGNNITATGTYTANFTPSYYFWSLIQCDQYGNVITGGLSYNSGYIAGVPSGPYTFTATNTWPCDTYYIVWFWTGNACGGQWVSAPLIHITLDPNFTLTSTQINSTTYTMTATYPTDNPTTSPGFGYWWDAVQIDPSTGNPISGTEINNASCWWTYPTALKFNGYNGTSTLGSCSNVGNFTAMDYYKISFGVWSNACPWISSSKQIDLCGLACRTEENPDGVLISELSGVEAGSTGLPPAIDQPEKISVYPNPTVGTFKLSTGRYTPQLMQVYDLNGKEVFSQSIDGPADINLSHLPAGIYNLQVTENNNRMNTRVIISR